LTAYAYTEDQLVEQPAIALFAALGWQTISAPEETYGAGGTLGRQTKGEVVLVPRLLAALAKLRSGRWALRWSGALKKAGLGTISKRRCPTRPNRHQSAP